MVVGCTGRDLFNEAVYKTMYGKPFPNALKRGMAEVIQNFDEYQIAKYNGGGKEVKFCDVLRITHPNAKASSKELCCKRAPKPIKRRSKKDIKTTN